MTNIILLNLHALPSCKISVAINAFSYSLTMDIIGGGGGKHSVVVKAPCYKPEGRGFETR
jgi:hypothetical protein